MHVVKALMARYVLAKSIFSAHVVLGDAHAPLSIPAAFTIPIDTNALRCAVMCNKGKLEKCMLFKTAKLVDPPSPSSLMPARWYDTNTI